MLHLLTFVRIRRSCANLVARPFFDHIILFFIAFNCITLAMERPSIEPDSREREFLSYSNYLFTIIFTMEMLLKVFVHGLFFGNHAYLNSGWNILDGVLVILSLVDVIMSLVSSSPGVFSILRVQLTFIPYCWLKINDNNNYVFI